MRDMIVVTTILILVFGGNYFIQQYIDNSGKEFLEKIRKLETSMDEAKIVKEKQVEEILNVWEKNEEKWIMIGYHNEINDIEDLVIECYVCYLQEDEEGFEVAYKKLERNIEDLRNREKITFTNIL